MNKEFVLSLFKITDIEVLNTWELMNQYWPRSYKDLVIENPWWLIKTSAGLIEIGRRKNVISIDWSDTPIRITVTEDDVTKSEQYVHAWSDEDCIRYLKVLAKEIKRIEWAGYEQERDCY